MASKLSKDTSFQKLVSGMNSVARKFLWMQVKLCTKSKQGRRFSLEEKVIALSIMKQSPKCYRFLQRIFILPCKTTLNNMLSNVNVQAGINPQIFNVIKQEVCFEVTLYVIYLRYYKLFSWNYLVTYFLFLGQQMDWTQKDVFHHIWWNEIGRWSPLL